VEHSARDLTDRVYTFITFYQSNETEESKAKIARQERLVPSIVFSIEQYEKYLIQLSKASKVLTYFHIIPALG